MSQKLSLEEFLHQATLGRIEGITPEVAQWISDNMKGVVTLAPTPKFKGADTRANPVQK